MRRVLPTILIGLLITCLPFGCGTSSRDVPAELIPSGSFVVLRINWQTVSKDEGLKRFVKSDQLESILRQLNLENDVVAEIVVFVASSESNGCNGMILRGSFDQHKMIDSLKTNGWLEQSIQGHRAFFNGDSCSLPLESNTIVYGTRAGVEGVIEAKANRAESMAASPNYKKLKAVFVDRQKPISVLLVAPQEIQDMTDASMKLSSVILNMASLGPLATLLEKIVTVRGAGLGIGHSGDSFPVELVVILKDESTAGLLSGSLNLLKQLAFAPQRNLPRADERAFNSFQSMFITRNKEVLSIKLTMSEQDLPPGLSGR
jgi:hypothetical protein